MPFGIAASFHAEKFDPGVLTLVSCLSMGGQYLRKSNTFYQGLASVSFAERHMQVEIGCSCLACRAACVPPSLSTAVCKQIPDNPNSDK